MIHLASLRRAGFFAAYSNLNDEKLIQLLTEKKIAEESSDFVPPLPLFTEDIEIIHEDTTKLLHQDMEADVCKGNNSYVSFLEAVGLLSGNPRLVTDAKEVWESEEGPIKVFCKIGGEVFSYEPEYQYDWLDDVIVNQVLQDVTSVSGVAFHLCSGPNSEWFGQDIYIMRLSPEEKNILETELNWSFDLEQDFEEEL